jgi:hypothetical protein
MLCPVQSIKAWPSILCFNSISFIDLQVVMGRDYLAVTIFHLSGLSPAAAAAAASAITHLCIHSILTCRL